MYTHGKHYPAMILVVRSPVNAGKFSRSVISVPLRTSHQYCHEPRAFGDSRCLRIGCTHLPAKFVMHAVGPIWRGGSHGERELLASAYRVSLELALANQREAVAFPRISSGAYGYPKAQALKVAVDTIGDFLLAHDMTVYLVVFDRAAYAIGGKLFYKPSSPAPWPSPWRWNCPWSLLSK